MEAKLLRMLRSKILPYLLHRAKEGSPMAKNPYESLPATSFWRNAVGNSAAPVPTGLYNKKWPINKSECIATAGSCFAQHIGRRLKSNGFNVMDVEPPPQGLSADDQGRFGYSIYSARYGNIYTARQLLQLGREAFGEFTPSDIVWEAGGAFYDALRPGVEPGGLESAAEVLMHRECHLERVREMFETMDLFVFTLGLTEAWIHKPSGTVYPTAPGTIAGMYDPGVYEFKNFDYGEIRSDLLEFREFVHSKQSKKCRFLLTVSPVPLTATATENHVMVATVYSKSVLRGVAGELSMAYDDIDYFPSYEIITNPWSKELYYEENLRSVKKEGVGVVMKTFLGAHLGEESQIAEMAHTSPAASVEQSSDSEEDVICEEAILDAFGREVS